MFVNVDDKRQRFFLQLFFTTRELPGERDNARNNAKCTHARKTTRGLDGQQQDVEESIRMTEDRDKWRKYVHGVANPRIEDG